MTRPLIHVEDLSFSFGSRILFSKLTFSVGPGELWAVVGDSGAGKSTLLKLLTGELKSSTGSVECLSSFSEVPQGLALCPGLSAFETIATGDLQNLNWFRTLTGLPKRSLAKAQELARLLKLSHVENQDVQKISGGERQRVALGRALLQKFHILVADEPVSALDHDLGEEIFRLLEVRVLRPNGAIVCSLHQRHLVSQFATHVLELSNRFELGWEIRKLSGDSR